MRSALVLTLFIGLVSCAGPAPGDDERLPGPPVLGDASADSPSAVDVVSLLEPDAPVEGTLRGATRFGYVFRAESDADVTVEVTQRGSSRSLDSQLTLYGPRGEDGRYGEALASDDDSGWGKLSRTRARVAEAGFYLAVVSIDPESGVGDSAQRYRLALSCDGAACGGRTVEQASTGVRWMAVSAERIAASIQAYDTATARIEAMSDAGALPADWAVSLDVDETVLDNVIYQREREELGVGYSAASWTRWVTRREASALPGVRAFLDRVRELGGRIALITNRSAAECPDTEANLAGEGIPYDVILCRTATSDKNGRWSALEDGTAVPGVPPVRLVMYVGDNIQDFPALGQEIRFMGEESFGGFADRFVLVPNPMYGSWERNE